MPTTVLPASGEADERMKSGMRLAVSPGITMELLYCALHDAATGFALVRGSSHIFAFANPAWQALAVQSSGPVIGRTLRRVCPALATADHLAMLEQVYATGMAARLQDCEIPAGAGRERRLLTIEHVPLRGPNGRIVAVLMIAQ